MCVAFVILCITDKMYIFLNGCLYVITNKFMTKNKYITDKQIMDNFNVS